MKFSERMGFKKITNDLQVNSMNDDLRNGLWNVYYKHIIDVLRGGFENRLPQYFSYIWAELFKKTIDAIPNLNDAYGYLRSVFFEYEWYEVYDFLELHVTDDFGRNVSYDHFHYFIEDVNKVLEREYSAYRFIERVITQISNQQEVDEVNEALNAGRGMFGSKYSGVNKHLELALKKLSDKKAPDYRNSIKESISAVESLCKKLVGDEKATLGKALKKLEERESIHPALKAAFSSLYGYTSDGDGIRHAIMDDGKDLDFHDAKYMLVTCSAFINLMIGKLET